MLLCATDTRCSRKRQRDFAPGAATWRTGRIYASPLIRAYSVHYKAWSTLATMSKQHCRSNRQQSCLLPVASTMLPFWQQSRTLLRHCCPKTATLSKQHSTLYYSTMLLRHCCWCGPGLNVKTLVSRLRRSVTARACGDRFSRLRRTICYTSRLRRSARYFRISRRSLSLFTAVYGRRAEPRAALAHPPHDHM